MSSMTKWKIFGTRCNKPIVCSLENSSGVAVLSDIVSQVGKSERFELVGISEDAWVIMNPVCWY